MAAPRTIERKLPHILARSGPITIEERDLHRTENINRLYSTLVDATADMRDGDEIARNAWMDCAESLVIDFRSNRVFYPAERHMAFAGYDRDARNTNIRKKWQSQQDLGQTESQLDEDFPIPSVESTVPTHYREIHFDDWLDVFLEYALLLSKAPEPDAQRRCYSVIAATLDCAVWYHDPHALLQIYVSYFTCALALRDDDSLQCGAPLVHPHLPILHRCIPSLCFHEPVFSTSER